MDFAAQRGRDSRYYSVGEEDDDHNSSRRTSFTLSPFSHLPPPSPSSTSSSPRSWTVPQAEPPTDGQPGSSGATDPPAPAASVEKEHMFDKVVTPSDVGKLNRLVIPKQHAEKYFPLDSSTNEKGLLLNFEDRNGKPWRFRYSYWNSSQSYVMTKGWSRFVKEKRLDAGDTVSFGRGVGEAARDRLFIDWKRRPEAQNPPNIPRIPLNPYSPMMSFTRSVMPWGRLYTQSASTMTPVSAYDHHQHHHHHHNQGGSYGYSTSYPYVYLSPAAVGRPSHAHLGVQMQHGGGSGSGDGSARAPVVFDSVPVAHSTITTNSKRVRLFGVNLDCSPSHGDSGAPAAASQVRPLPPVLSLQLGLGEATGAGADIVESPSDDKQPMSLDLDI